MCLKKIALEWHIDLSYAIRDEMNEDLAIWKDELLREYRLNKFEFLRKTKKMTFRFDDKKQTLSQYLTRKINLLHDVNVQDENTIVRHLWDDLKAQLALTTSMREDDDTIEAFNKRVRNNEQAARKVWNLSKKSFSRF